MITEFINKNSSIAVIGLGYVGLPIALEFARIFRVIGFDINEERLNQMRNKIDPSKELDSSTFENRDILFTSSLEELHKAKVFIVAVPTPIDKYNQPDLTPLISATRYVGKVLKRGDTVIYESTVYPGCTEEEALPILEQLSGLKCGTDFKIGYSPERINPGDKLHTLTNTIKVVSGCDHESLEFIAALYSSIISVGVHRATSIKVAEAAKIIENTQRDVNIALMNEFSIIFGRIGINTYDVIESAETKWNFLKFYPGLVGGHCIGVDPYYLEHKAKALKYHPQIISAGRFINDTMGGYFAKKIVKQMIASGINILGSKVLVMGITFKENVSDIRNSKVVDIIKEFKDYGIEVDVVDPYADHKEVYKEYHISLIDNITEKYDAIVVAVGHREYRTLQEEWFLQIAQQGAVLGDIKGLYRNKITKLKYLSL